MPKLKRELSLFTATFYGIGIILGAGIYVLIGQAAGIAGNAVWLSFIVAAIIATFTGLSYAELAGMFPKDAAEYVYTKKAFGKKYLSFIVQWIMLFTLVVSATTVALGFAGYFSFLFGVPQLAAAAGLLVLVSLVNYIGIRSSTRIEVVSTIIEMSGLLLAIIIGFMLFGKMETNYFSSPSGLSSVLPATALIFFAYLGFEELVNMSEETKNASKIIPKALVIALGISTLLYILVSLASVTAIGADALSQSAAPLAEVVSAGIPQASLLMSVIALFATGNTVLIILIVASRMLYGLSSNNTLPNAFGRLGKRKTPYISVFTVMIFSILFLFIGGIKTIASLTDVGIFAVYLFVNAAVIQLRYKMPKAKRTFRSPISIGKFPLLALLGIASSFLMFMQFEPALILYEIAVAVIGVGIYEASIKIKKHREKAHPRLFRKHTLTSNGLNKVKAAAR
ncbi:MAG: amino acid permease [Candidatus Aenigmarchaeota archaeon]|nr:amino acid permease [Candidatus Aenigmarchaeota archaeon]